MLSNCKRQDWIYYIAKNIFSSDASSPIVNKKSSFDFSLYTRSRIENRVLPLSTFRIPTSTYPRPVEIAHSEKKEERSAFKWETSSWAWRLPYSGSVSRCQKTRECSFSYTTAPWVLIAYYSMVARATSFQLSAKFTDLSHTCSPFHRIR